MEKIYEHRKMTIFLPCGDGSSGFVCHNVTHEALHPPHPQEVMQMSAALKEEMKAP